MPTIAFKSRVRASSDCSALTLVVKHRIIVGEPSDIVHDLKASLPECIDVFLDSCFSITVSGKLNGGRIAPETLMDSRTAPHLAEYLRMNADELGINAVSNAHISDQTGLLTLLCTGSRRLPTSSESGLTHSRLIGFDIDYIWLTKIAATQSGQANITAPMNPFSRQLSLPFLTVINDAVQRLVTFQFVRRYPLIFGSWCKVLCGRVFCVHSDIYMYSNSILKGDSLVQSLHPSLVFWNALRTRTFAEELKKYYRHLTSLSLPVLYQTFSIASLQKDSVIFSSRFSNFFQLPGNSRVRRCAATFALRDGGRSLSFIDGQLLPLGIKASSFQGFYFTIDQRAMIRERCAQGLSDFCIRRKGEDDALLDILPSPGEDSNNQLDIAIESHAEVFRVLIEHNDEVDAYVDGVVAPGYLRSQPQDCSMPYSHLDTPYDCDISEECLRGPHLFALHKATPSSSISEDSSDLLDLDEDENMHDFSGHLLPGYFANNHILINDASADSDLDYPVISHRGRSPDINPSQEKSYLSSMGMGSPLNLLHTALDPSDFEPCADPPSPFHGYKTDRINDLQFAPDSNVLHTDAHSVDLLNSTPPFDLQLDYDSDDHGIMQTIPFEDEPNSGALTFGKTVNFGQLNSMKVDSRHDMSGSLQKVSDNSGFLLVDFD